MTRDELLEEQSYVERSLADLDRERSAGDLETEQYERLRARYEERAAEIERELASRAASSGPPTSAASVAASRRRRSRLSSRRAQLVTGWSAFACLAAASVLLILAIAKVGPFSSTPPLTVQQRVQIELAEAAVLGGKGDVAQAMAVYDQVLTLDPKQPEALASGGWLARLAGLSRHSTALVHNGDAEIQAAVRLAPGYAQARAYDAALLLEDRSQPDRAAAEFRQMLDDHPSATLIWSVRKEAARAFAAAHERLPSRIANAQKPSSSSGL